MNAVPDPLIKLKSLLFSTFPNIVIKYPGKSGERQGDYAKEVLHLTDTLEQADYPYTKEYLRRNPDETEKYRKLREKVEQEI